MEKSAINQVKSSGEEKIAEYVRRIKDGEDKGSVLDGLPDSFRLGIEKGLEIPIKEEVLDDEIGIPPQYRGLDSETLDFIWTSPVYVDNEKNERFKNIKSEAIARLKQSELLKLNSKKSLAEDENRLTQIRQELGIVKPIVEKLEPSVIEKRKKLYGWEAGYELALVAKNEGVDLSKLSREEYAEYAIKNSLAIDDSQLRMSPFQRMATSIQEIVQVVKEKQKGIDKKVDLSFAQFAQEMQRIAGESNRVIQEGVKVRSGTRDSNSWLFFGINKSLNESRGETFKSYVSVKDLNKLTPDRFKSLMVELKNAGYNGDIKIFQDTSLQGIKLNDQIVMHGATEADAKLGLQIAESFFGDEIDQKSFGKDEIIDGENKSYSEILAQKIKKSVFTSPLKKN